MYSSVGEMRQYTVLVPPCSRRRSKSTSSTTLVCASVVHVCYAMLIIVRTLGYRHNPFQHCPQGELHKKGKCWCNPKENFGASYVFLSPAKY